LKRILKFLRLKRRKCSNEPYYVFLEKVANNQIDINQMDEFKRHAMFAFIREQSGVESEHKMSSLKQRFVTIAKNFKFDDTEKLPVFELPVKSETAASAEEKQNFAQTELNKDYIDLDAKERNRLVQKLWRKNHPDYQKKWRKNNPNYNHNRLSKLRNQNEISK